MSNLQTGNVRVLHAVRHFLGIRDNWIYPQVTKVTGIDGFVSCITQENRSYFPLSQTQIVQDRRVNRLQTIQRARRLKPHILHAHFGKQGWRSLRVAGELGIPLVTSFYGADAWKVPKVDRRWRIRYQELFEHGRLFLVEGPAMKSRLIELGCPPEKAVIHRIGVDLPSLAYVERSFSPPLRIVMVARFVEKKGLVEGVRACGLALAAGLDLCVTIVGDAQPDAPAEQAIKADIEKLTADPVFTGKIQLSGFRPLSETRRILSQHSVFLCPSRHAKNGDAEGGSPVVLTEAMAQGLLCIGTAHCDIPSLIEDNVTGLLCPEDSNGLAGVLRQVGCSSKQLLQQTTRSARQHVENHFDLDRQMEAQAEIYRALLAGEPRSALP